MKRTLVKAGRDLGVLLAATALWFVAENVGNLGLPPEIAPMVGAGALMLYRVLRGMTTASAPA